MNKREIVIEALRRGKPEAVPYNIDFTNAMREKMRRHLGLGSADAVGEAIGNYFVQLNVGSVTGPSEGVIEEIYPKKVGENTYCDDWGCVWRRDPGDDIGAVIDPPLKEPSLKGLRIPEPPSRAKWLEEFCSGPHDHFRLVTLSSVVFQRAWFLRGMDNLLLDLAAEPAFVHELMDAIVEHYMRIVREVIRYDVDAVMFLDDWGHQGGPFMSPAMWREFVKPRLTRICALVRDKGLFVFIHSCGEVSSLIPDIIDAGADVLNPFQPEVMDVYALKRKYGKRLSFYGGVSTQQTLPYGTVAEVRADVRDKIRRLGEGGGYVLAPAHAVQADVPIENIMAFVEEARKGG